MLAIKQLLDTARKIEGSPLSDIQRVFLGDPIVIQENILPAIAIQPIVTDYKKRGSVYDQKIHKLDIRLVYNSKTFFGKSSGPKVDLSTAVWELGQIKFNSSTSHDLEEGDSISIAGCLPEAFNGTFAVKSIISLNEFTVEKTADPGNLTIGGKVTKGILDEVFSVTDSIEKVEPTIDKETIANSICGIIQKNYNLAHFVDGIQVIPCEQCDVTTVRYDFGSKVRPFTSYEVTTSVQALVVAKR